MSMEYTPSNPFAPKASLYPLSNATFEIHLHLPGVVSNVQLTHHLRHFTVSGVLRARALNLKSANSRRRVTTPIWTNQPCGAFAHNIPFELGPGKEYVVLKQRHKHDDFVVRFAIRSKVNTALHSRERHDASNCGDNTTEEKIFSGRSPGYQVLYHIIRVLYAPWALAKKASRIPYTSGGTVSPTSSRIKTRRIRILKWFFLAESPGAPDLVETGIDWAGIPPYSHDVAEAEHPINKDNHGTNPHDVTFILIDGEYIQHTLHSVAGYDIDTVEHREDGDIYGPQLLDYTTLSAVNGRQAPAYTEEYKDGHQQLSPDDASTPLANTRPPTPEPSKGRAEVDIKAYCPRGHLLDDPVTRSTNGCPSCDSLDLDVDQTAHIPADELSENHSGFRGPAFLLEVPGRQFEPRAAMPDD